MGAFVGVKISPFLRRRKGRVGTDRIIEKTAPTFAGAALNVVAANWNGMICSPGGSIGGAGSYQYNKDFGLSAWTSVAMGASQWIGNSDQTRHVAEMRPLGDYNNYQRISVAGIHSGIGGAIFAIDENLRFILENTTIANAPQEGIGWQPNGKIFCTAADPVANISKCRGGQSQTSPETVDISVEAGATGLHTILPLLIPNDDRQIWIASDVGPSRFLLRITRTETPSAVWAKSFQVAGPVAGLHITKFLQRGALIFGVGPLKDGVRSLDYGVTFSAILDVGHGPISDLHRYGNRLYAMQTTSPRLRISRNNGTTWQTDTTALPSGTAVPDSYLVDPWGNRWIFCHDGAINRLYKHSTYGEI